MKGLSAPHGGTLVNRVADDEAGKAIKDRARGLPQIKLNSRQLSDLELIATGAFSPLQGFMDRDTYKSVVEDMRLPEGLPWSLPITLSISRKQGIRLKEGSDVALVSGAGETVAVLHLEEKFDYDKEREAAKIYLTTDTAHPGVKSLYEQGDVLLGGRITYLPNQAPRDFAEYRLPPAATRCLFQGKGWKRVVGFQTRNPVHRAHEYIQKCALEMVDGLLLHPLVGETKSDDIPAPVRMRCYQVLLENYYARDRVVLSVFPATMRYAGPREAVFHAIARKNYGCSHFIVGRDHAGVGNYYGPYDAQHIFDCFQPAELGITPLFFDNTFYCRRCQGMASAKTCPHDPKDHIVLSGTQLRVLLEAGQSPPPEFTRSEVAEVLLEGAKKPSVNCKVSNNPEPQKVSSNLS